MSQSGLGFLCSHLILEESSSCVTHGTAVSVSGCMVLWVLFLNCMSRCQHRSLFYSERKVWSLLAKFGSASSQSRIRLSIGCILLANFFLQTKKKRGQHLADRDFLPRSDFRLAVRIMKDQFMVATEN